MDTAEGDACTINTLDMCSVLQYLIVDFWPIPFTTKFEVANFFLSSFRIFSPCYLAIFSLFHCESGMGRKRYVHHQQAVVGGMFLTLMEFETSINPIEVCMVSQFTLWLSIMHVFWVGSCTLSALFICLIMKIL